MTFQLNATFPGFFHSQKLKYLDSIIMGYE